MYVVTQTGNLDYDKKAWLCRTREDGEKLLQEKWEDYFNEALVELPFGYANGLIEDECYHEDDYAVVTSTDGTTWFELFEIEE